jgi:hypothetical protein
LFQPLSAPELGWPPAVVAKGEGVQLSGGSPIAVTGPEVPGYRRHLGTGLFLQQGYACYGSVR